MTNHGSSSTTSTETIPRRSQSPLKQSDILKQTVKKPKNKIGLLRGGIFGTADWDSDMNLAFQGYRKDSTSTDEKKDKKEKKQQQQKKNTLHEHDDDDDETKTDNNNKNERRHDSSLSWNVDVVDDGHHDLSRDSVRSTGTTASSDGINRDSVASSGTAETANTTSSEDSSYSNLKSSIKKSSYSSSSPVPRISFWPGLDDSSSLQPRDSAVSTASTSTTASSSSCVSKPSRISTFRHRVPHQPPRSPRRDTTSHTSNSIASRFSHIAPPLASGRPSHVPNGSIHDGDDAAAVELSRESWSHMRDSITTSFDTATTHSDIMDVGKHQAKLLESAIKKNQKRSIFAPISSIFSSASGSGVSDHHDHHLDGTRGDHAEDDDINVMLRRTTQAHGGSSNGGKQSSTIAAAHQARREINNLRLSH